MILINPQRHYISFYDVSSSSSRSRKNHISRLDILKPKDRQRLFDIRHASPKTRHRLLKWDRKLRKKSLLRLTLEKTLPAAFLAGKITGHPQMASVGKTGVTHKGNSEGASE